MKAEARLQKKLKDKVICKTCPRYCVIAEGKEGFCKTRINVGGKLYTLIYAEVSSLNVDPIEKKPLFHFWPGSTSLSIGTVGCNLQCRYCQNWQISAKSLEEVSTQQLKPEEIVEMAKKNGCKSISYTYNEPGIWFEYVFDTAKLAHRKGILNVLKTNGYISKEALKKLIPFIDAASIDLKAVNDEFYQKLCNTPSYKPVIETAKLLIKNKKHVEIVNLVIPGWNDKEEDFRNLARVVVKELGKDIPVHFTRFYPSHKLMNVETTPVKTLERARNIAKKEGLKFVYSGNVPGHEYENTYCPKCNAVLVGRVGFDVVECKIKSGRCIKCGKKIPIVGECV